MTTRLLSSMNQPWANIRPELETRITAGRPLQTMATGTAGPLLVEARTSSRYPGDHGLAAAARRISTVLDKPVVAVGRLRAVPELAVRT
jgi:hypothetical protein